MRPIDQDHRKAGSRSRTQKRQRRRGFLRALSKKSSFSEFLGSPVPTTHRTNFSVSFYIEEGTYLLSCRSAQNNKADTGNDASTAIPKFGLSEYVIMLGKLIPSSRLSGNN